MLTLERDATVSAPPRRRIQAIDARASGMSIAHEDDVMKQWHAAFRRLTGILSNREDLIADGLCPPTDESITFATLFLTSHKRRDPEHVPTIIVPNGEGGVSIEWRTPDDLTRLEFGPDGQLDLIIISGGRIVHRSASQA